MHDYTALPEESPSDGSPPDNFGVPPETVGAGPVFKRHGDMGNTEVTQTKKMMRCSHISAPLMVSVIVHTMGIVKINCTFKLVSRASPSYKKSRKGLVKWVALPCPHVEY